MFSPRRNSASPRLLGSIQGPGGYAGASNFGSSAKERRKTAKNCPCYIHIYESPASPCSQLAPQHLGGQHMLCHHQQTSQGPDAPHSCLFRPLQLPGRASFLHGSCVCGWRHLGHGAPTQHKDPNLVVEWVPAVL